MRKGSWLPISKRETMFAHRTFFFFCAPPYYPFATYLFSKAVLKKETLSVQSHLRFSFSYLPEKMGTFKPCQINKRWSIIWRVLYFQLVPETKAKPAAEAALYLFPPGSSVLPYLLVPFPILWFLQPLTFCSFVLFVVFDVDGAHIVLVVIQFPISVGVSFVGNNWCKTGQMYSLPSTSTLPATPHSYLPFCPSVKFKVMISDFFKSDLITTICRNVWGAIFFLCLHVNYPPKNRAIE